MVTIDIEADGKKYILQWWKPGENQDEPFGYIEITEACQDEDDDDQHMGCDLETYDLRGIE